MEKKEYIERGVVVDILRKYSTENPSSLGRHSGVADIAMCEVDRVPAADVVKVVRCKDCKNVKMLIDIIGEPHLFCCSGRSINRMRVEFDDFCSHGERKEE